MNRLDSAAYMLRSDVVATVVGDGAVLLDLESKFFFSVNQSGWAILQLFEVGCTPEEAMRQASALGAPRDDAASRAFVELLIREKIVTEIESPGGAAEVNGPEVWAAPTLEKHREPLQRIMVSAFDPGLPLAE